jgi:hypothetical protein
MILAKDLAVWGDRMPYILEPLVGGVLGDRTRLDLGPVHRTTPPTVLHLEYTLDHPTDDDLLEAFPAFLISRELAARATQAGLSGLRFEEAEISKSDGYIAAHGDKPHKDYVRLIPGHDEGSACWLNAEFLLCVSDRMMGLLRAASIAGCDITHI